MTTPLNTLNDIITASRQFDSGFYEDYGGLAALYARSPEWGDYTINLYNDYLTNRRSFDLNGNPRPFDDAMVAAVKEAYGLDSDMAAREVLAAFRALADSTWRYGEALGIPTGGALSDAMTATVQDRLSGYDAARANFKDMTGVTPEQAALIAAAVATGAGALGYGPMAGAMGTAGTAGTATQGAMLAEQTAAFGAAGEALTAEALAVNTAAAGVNAGIMADYAAAAGTAASAATAAAESTGGTMAGNYDPLLDLELPMTQEDMLAAQTAEFGPEGALWTQEAGLAGVMPAGTEQSAMLAAQTAEFGLPGSTLTAEAAMGVSTPVFGTTFIDEIMPSSDDLLKKVASSWLQGYLGQKAAEEQNDITLKALEAAKTPWAPQAAAALSAFDRANAAYQDYMDNARYYTDPDTGNPYPKTAGILSNLFSTYENTRAPTLHPVSVGGFTTFGVV